MVRRGPAVLSGMLAGLLLMLTSSAPENGPWTISPQLPGHGGLFTFDPHRLDHPVTTVRALLDATIREDGVVRLEVRGRRADRSWSEWVGIRQGTAAELATRSETVQVRLAVGGTPTPDVRGITLTAWNDPAIRFEPAPREGHTFRVFATRVGLVGNATANGHVIVERDHFVALPSRRPLNSPGAGDYTARVCTGGGRCAWAPVSDVGPWNIADDYWNPGRAMWPGLPRGTPQAQAAFSDGYNDGEDQFGRKVANPAGIDLADGTFRDALKLKDNAWVDVTYQWTGSGAWGTAAIDGPMLTVRAGASTSHAPVGMAAKHAHLRLECYVLGQSVIGLQGNSAKWFRLMTGQFVPAANVEVGSAPGAC